MAPASAEGQQDIHKLVGDAMAACWIVTQL